MRQRQAQRGTSRSTNNHARNSGGVFPFLRGRDPPDGRKYGVHHLHGHLCSPRRGASQARWIHHQVFPRYSQSHTSINIKAWIKKANIAVWHGCTAHSRRGLGCAYRNVCIPYEVAHQCSIQYLSGIYPLIGSSLCSASKAIFVGKLLDHGKIVYK